LQYASFEVPFETDADADPQSDSQPRAKNCALPWVVSAVAASLSGIVLPCPVCAQGACAAGISVLLLVSVWMGGADVGAARARVSQDSPLGWIDLFGAPGEDRRCREPTAGPSAAPLAIRLRETSLRMTPSILIRIDPSWRNRRLLATARLKKRTGPEGSRREGGESAPQNKAARLFEQRWSCGSEARLGEAACGRPVYWPFGLGAGCEAFPMFVMSLISTRRFFARPVAVLSVATC
jgi:hypothetical protein